MILQLLERLNVLIIFVINIRDTYDTHKKKIGNTSLPRSILVAAQSWRHRANLLFEFIYDSLCKSKALSFSSSFQFSLL